MELQIPVKMITRNIKLHSLLGNWISKETLFTYVIRYYLQVEYDIKCLDPEPQNPKFETREIAKYIAMFDTTKNRHLFETMLLRTLNIWLLTVEARFYRLPPASMRRNLINIRGAYATAAYDPETDMLTITTREYDNEINTRTSNKTKSNTNRLESQSVNRNGHG